MWAVLGAPSVLISLLILRVTVGLGHLYLVSSRLSQRGLYGLHPVCMTGCGNAPTDRQRGRVNQTLWSRDVHHVISSFQSDILQEEVITQTTVYVNITISSFYVLCSL